MGIDRQSWGPGVCGGVYDGDPKTDLFVTYWGPDASIRNPGDCKFVEVEAATGAAGGKRGGAPVAHSWIATEMVTWMSS